VGRVRAASSMRVVRQGAVTVDVGECALCNDLFSEEAVIGEDPMPPGHPGCTCSVIGAA